MDVQSSESQSQQTWHITGSLHLLPLVVISALLMVIGIVGNSTVCFVSIARMRRSVLNNFVLSLALAELIGCMFTIPVEITQLLNIYSFDYPYLCKCERYLRSFLVVFTTCLLIAIATERYQRIVKPHRKHVTSFHFRLTIIGSLLLSSVAAIPEAILAGTEVINTEYGTGHMCSSYSASEYLHTVFPPLWVCFIVVVYVISTSAIGSIYCVIAIQIWKRGKLMTNRRSRPNTPDLTLRRRVDYLKKDLQCDLNSTCETTVSCVPVTVSSTNQFKSTGQFMDSKIGINSSSEEATVKLLKEKDDQILPIKQNHTNHEDDNSATDVQTRKSTNTVRDVRESKRVSKDRSSLFTEILFHFQSKSSASNPSSVGEKSKEEDEGERSSSTNKDNGKIPGHGERSGIELVQNYGRLQNKTLDNSMDILQNTPGRQGSFKETKCKGGIVQEVEIRLGTKNGEKEEKEERNREEQGNPKRKMSAEFLDRLSATVERRRRKAATACLTAYGHESSCEDLLSPPSFHLFHHPHHHHFCNSSSATPTTVPSSPLSLSPMGSVRSSSGGGRGGYYYSRKRTTFILSVMTLTTVLSLLPHVIATLYRTYRGRGPSVEPGLSPDCALLFRSAWNSFFLSLASHPYVYGFWNGRFKQALMSLFQDVRKEGRRGMDRFRKYNGFSR